MYLLGCGLDSGQRNISLFIVFREPDQDTATPDCFYNWRWSAVIESNSGFVQGPYYNNWGGEILIACAITMRINALFTNSFLPFTNPASSSRIFPWHFLKASFLFKKRPSKAKNRSVFSSKFSRSTTCLGPIPFDRGYYSFGFNSTLVRLRLKAWWFCDHYNSVSIPRWFD